MRLSLSSPFSPFYFDLSFTVRSFLFPLLHFELPTELDNLIAMQNLRTSANKGVTTPTTSPSPSHRKVLRGGIMTPVPKQTKKPMGQDNARGVLLSSSLGKLHAKYLRSDATRHVQSAVLPTQLGGFPSKTIEFGNHLVYQRASVYRQKGVSSAVIFLDRRRLFTVPSRSLFWAPCWKITPGQSSWVRPLPTWNLPTTHPGSGR